MKSRWKSNFFRPSQFCGHHCLFATGDWCDQRRRVPGTTRRMIEPPRTNCMNPLINSYQLDSTRISHLPGSFRCWFRLQLAPEDDPRWHQQKLDQSEVLLCKSGLGLYLSWPDEHGHSSGLESRCRPFFGIVFRTIHNVVQFFMGKMVISNQATFFGIISLFSDKSLLFGVHITLLGTVFVSMAQGLGTWPGLCRLAIPSLEMVDVSAPRLPQTGLVGTCGDHPPGYQDRTMGIPVNQWRDRGFWILTWVSHFLRGLVHQEVFCQVWMLKLSRTSWTN